MKILKLEIFNIASLKGHHEIDFTKVYQASSLFAITGKTGSGKSTLLNSISLALYGQNYKKGSQNNDFVTLGEAEGSIRLFFTQENKHFCAHWSMKLRKKNGELLKKPSLKRILFEVVDNDLIAKDVLPEDILALNFQEFCKTTILNQGEFARFLTSSFTERKDILEKFYQGENLEKLNITLREQIKEKEQKLQIHEQTIEGLKSVDDEALVSEDDLKEKKNNLLKLQEQAIHLELIASNTHELYKNTISYNDNELRLSDSNNKLTELTKEHNDNSIILKEHEEKFNQASTTLKDKRPTLQKCIENLKILDLKSKQIADLEKSHHKFQNDIEKLNQDLKEVEGQKEENKLKLTNVDEFLKPISPYSNEIGNDHQVLLELKQQFMANSNQLKVINSDLEGHKKRILSLESEIKKSQEKIQNTPLEELESKNKKDQEVYHQNDKDYTRLNIKKNDLLNNEKQIDDLEKHISKYKLKIESLEKENNANKEQLSLLEDSLNYHKLLQSQKHCLDQSLKDGHCLICGNEDLSAVKNKKLTSDEKRYHDNLSKYESLNQTILTIDKELNEIKIQYNVAHEKMGSSTQNRESILLEINNIIKDPSIQTTEQLAPLLMQWEKDQQTLNTQIQDNEKKIAQTRLLTQELSGLLVSKEEINKTLVRLESDYQGLSNKELEIKSTLEDYKSKYHMLNAKSLNELLELLDEHHKSLSVKEKLEDSFKFLEEKNKSLIEYLSKVKEDKQKTESKTLELNQEQGLLRAFINENSSGEPIKDLNLLEEKMSKIEGQFTHSQNIEKSLKIKIAEFSAKVSSTKEQLQALSLLKNESIEKIKNIKIIDSNFNIDTFDNELSHAIKLIDKFNMHLDQDLLTMEYLELIKNDSMETFNNFKSYLRELELEYTKEVTLLEAKKERDQKVKELNKLLKNDLDELTKLKDLFILIGKDEFRNYVLSIIESNLIEQTNKELQSICQGRYVLTQSHKTNRMISEFKIIDYYRDGFERKISTLSGGETFLVSLAMALALAELTRGKVQIDSLFIDEGFGTLDDNSIDEIYELLQQIQSTGKQIGVISHIKALTERIPININLDKNSQGLSQIKFSYN